MRRTLMRYELLLVVLGCMGFGGCARGNSSTPADSANAQASRPHDSARASAEKNGSAKRDDRRTLLFVGTSLTAGYGLDPDSAYPQQIQRMIDSAGFRYTVVNAGVSGETSSALIRRLDWLLRQPLGVVVIETGANDGLRGIPIETMRANIQQIIERVRRARPGAQVVLVQMEAPPNLGAQYTRQFREVFRDVAKRNDAVLLPFLLQDVAGNRDLNQADGIHPNNDGERIVARNVWKGLRPLLQ